MRTWLNAVRALGDDVEPLWVGGVALVQIYLASRLLPLTGEPYEWAQYLLLGVLFPLILLAGSRARTGALLKIGLALACLVAGTCLLPRGSGMRSLTLILAGGQLLTLLVVALVCRRWAPDSVGLPPRPAAIIVGGAVLVVAWGVAARWVWWLPHLEGLTASPYAIAVTAGAVILATPALVRGNPNTPAAGRRWAWLSNVPALVVLLLASLELPPGGAGHDPAVPFDPTTHHHWGAVVGSAALIRQGGWPLWDVPCQYGFLNTLAVAALRIGDVWQSLYTLNALLLLLSAAFVFYLLRSCRPGAVQYVFALLVTLAGVFLIPGWPSSLIGPFTFPAIGPFRFFWCYGLLAVLVWDHRRAGRGSAGRAPLWVGCAAWLVGTLWSAESATYCLTIWAPALTLLALRRALVLHPGPGTWKRRAGILAAWLAVPPSLLTAAVTGVTVVYAIALGHAPDWYAYFEYCLAFKTFALPIDPQGPVWALLLVFCAAATAAACCLRGEAPLRDLPLLTGAAASLWAASSYYVGRSHDVNATNLTPVALTCAAVVLYVLARRRESSSWPALVRLALLPLLTVLLAVVLVDRTDLRKHFRDMTAGYHIRVHQRLPAVDADLAELLATAGVRADDPIAFLDNGLSGRNMCPVWYALDAEGRIRRSSEPQLWLPASPVALFVPLSPERGETYFARFAARSRRGGWLIQPNPSCDSFHLWVLEQLEKTHVPGRTVANAGWRLTWFEYRGDDPNAHAAVR